LRIAKNDAIMNGTNQYFKEWWIKGLESLAASLIPAQARIASQRDSMAPLDHIPPIESRQLAMYYEAISGYEVSVSRGSHDTFYSPTSQLVFDSMQNFQTRFIRDKREEFSNLKT
jgi:hypothetical protein